MVSKIKLVVTHNLVAYLGFSIAFTLNCFHQDLQDPDGSRICFVNCRIKIHDHFCLVDLYNMQILFQASFKIVRYNKTFGYISKDIGF